MDDKANTGNTAAEASENSTAATKKAAKSKLKVQREKATHPPTSEMVNTAIKELKDRKGSSLQAIKKYIASTYKVDGEKFAPFIKKYLKSAVTSGAVVQTKGKGASGSFKLSTGKAPEGASKAKKAPAKKAAQKRAPSVEKKTVSKKTAPAKKPPAKKKPAAVEKKAVVAKKSAAKAAVAKAKVATEAKNMLKTKKSAKAPAAKTKTPKPKKAAASKAVKSTAKK
ncbi:uncharacterized protein LOC143423469 [Xylocopa sonorina]|uniref:uncharacterized protein LOC143423469 n=1 Tax=Xylocopa sonorina TaxID=1818115 RepID=UPI00403B1EBC